MNLPGTVTLGRQQSLRSHRHCLDCRFKVRLFSRRGPFLGTLDPPSQKRSSVEYPRPIVIRTQDCRHDILAPQVNMIQPAENSVSVSVTPSRQRNTQGRQLKGKFVSKSPRRRRQTHVTRWLLHTCFPFVLGYEIAYDAAYAYQTNI